MPSDPSTCTRMCTARSVAGSGPSRAGVARAHARESPRRTPPTRECTRTRAPGHTRGAPAHLVEADLKNAAQRVSTPGPVHAYTREAANRASLCTALCGAQSETPRRDPNASGRAPAREEPPDCAPESGECGHGSYPARGRGNPRAPAVAGRVSACARARSREASRFQGLAEATIAGYGERHRTWHRCTKSGLPRACTCDACALGRPDPGSVVQCTSRVHVTNRDAIRCGADRMVRLQNARSRGRWRAFRASRVSSAASGVDARLCGLLSASRSRQSTCGYVPFR